MVMMMPPAVNKTDANCGHLFLRCHSRVRPSQIWSLLSVAINSCHTVTFCRCTRLLNASGQRSLKNTVVKYVAGKARVDLFCCQLLVCVKNRRHTGKHILLLVINHHAWSPEHDFPRQFLEQRIQFSLSLPRVGRRAGR